MKRIATGLLFAAGYANAWSFEELNGLRTPAVTVSAAHPMADPTVKHCSETHCSEIGAVLTDTCKKNNWQEGKVVMVYNLGEKETCYCNCPKTGLEDAEEVKYFISQDLAYRMSLEKDNFRAMNDSVTKATVQELLDYFQKVYPDVTFHNAWEDNTVNAIAWKSIFGKRNVKIYGGLARHKTVEREGLALVIAHELGHHYAGRPTGMGGLSCEGQADWGGARDLMRTAYPTEEYVTVMRKAIPQMAGFFNAPDSPVVPDLPSAGCAHPQGPCRIATYYAALSLEHGKPSCAGPTQ